ncbi:glycosyltransferase family 2 protein [Gramella sp. KN1008]|uniref:glycosyltransferase family 2 protein n=1 Tax=Gramella sp. KN1008 TaxID=2529298 RepID=UPI0010395EBE|nr:glycosyltransferase family 2 protein [Gramella sp. KN1008]TBW25593.1 glycosyltransferase family 2 protein [Gramella sp. KN1008]
MDQTQINAVYEMNDKVSVIMATYNRAYCISTAIESILKQTHQNWELLVMDDQSTDNTAEVVRKYVDQDERVKYHRLEKNLGCSGARNEGMKICEGDFITYLDSDDEYDLHKLEKQVKVFRESSKANLGVVSCGAIDFMDGKEYNRRMPVPQENLYISLLEKRKNLGAGSPFLMVKREVVFEDKIFFDQDMPAMIDWDFLLRISRKYEFDFVEEYLVFVNHHSNDRMYNYDSAIKALKLEYNKYMEWFKEKPASHFKFVRYSALLMAHYQSVEVAKAFLKESVNNFDDKESIRKIKILKGFMPLLKIKILRLLYLKILND